MNIYLVSIFPDIFTSFLETSLIKKWIDKKIFKIKTLDPRSLVKTKWQYIDDEIYGGGAGMLMKAKPAIDSVEKIMKSIKNKSDSKIIFVSPSEKIFTQEVAHELSNIKNLIFVCWRYEWIDYRFEQYMTKKYKKQFEKISLGQFVTLWWEAPAMTMVEAIVRLVPWVIKEESSRQDESYSLEYDMKNIEYPQYTRPEEVLWLKVPEILLGGHHAKIKEWRKKNSTNLSSKKKWKK